MSHLPHHSPRWLSVLMLPAFVIGIILLVSPTADRGAAVSAQDPPAKTDTPAAAAPPANDSMFEAKRIATTTTKPSKIHILVIGAHPADVFDQSGGTMAHHVARGDMVSCAVLTDGVRVHDKVITDEMQQLKQIPEEAEVRKTMAVRKKVKEKEVIHACSLLGVRENDVHFLGADNAILLVNEKHIRQLAALIRKLKPQVIITHYPYEEGGLGSDHPITGQMAVHAVSLAAGIDPADRMPPHKVAQVFFFGQGSAAARTHLWSGHGGFYNDIFVDITDVADKKVACLNAMDSQGYGGNYAKKRIETTDGAFGTKRGVAYAEGFISLYSTTQYYLPVSEIDLQFTKSSDHESLIRRSYRVKLPD